MKGRLKLKKENLFKSIRHWQILSLVLGILLVLSSFNTISASFGGSVSKSKAAENALNFINNVVFEGKVNAKVDSVKETNGVYKIKLNVNGRTVDSYVSKDGKLLFPQGIELNGDYDLSNKEAESSEANLPKSDKPKVELFVMSYCPYGLQMEKGILPVLNELKDKVDFELKFVNYAMHGKKEIDENLRQYCIQKEFSEKLIPYLEEFVKSGDYKKALASVGLEESDLKSCLDSADKQFRVSEIYNDPDKKEWMGRFPKFLVYDADNQKYGVRGSPTLVVNGKVVRSSRDSQSLLETICSAFSNKPSACSSDLSGFGTPSPGFGMAEGGSGSNGGCGA